MDVMEQARTVEPAAPAKAPMRRKGSVKGRILEPTNLRERLISRRQELGLSQEQVANQIEFWNNKKRAWKILSRSAYCMYESGEVPPDQDKINRLAEVLHTTPQWLSYGDSERHVIQEVEYDAAASEFGHRTFHLDDWLKSRFEGEPTEVVVCTVNDFTPTFKPGDIAVVRKGIEPTTAGGEFAYAQGTELRVAHITRPHAGGPFRVYDADLKNYAEADAGALHFLGKVIGRLGDL
jgi:transcriptional regulator with XRE-family HTH domain